MSKLSLGDLEDDTEEEKRREREREERRNAYRDEKRELMGGGEREEGEMSSALRRLQEAEDRGTESLESLHRQQVAMCKYSLFVCVCV